MAITDWEIQKTRLACATSGREFAEEEDIYSALYDEGNQFVRRDYAVECWPPPDMEKVFSFWKTRIPKKDAPVKKFLDDEVILDFFRRLEGRTEPQKQGFRYVLALLLMRKKVLKFKEMRRIGDDTVMVLHERVADCDYDVVDPRFSEQQLEQVSEEISQILNIRV